MITFYKDIHSVDVPYYGSIEKALKRIRDGESRERVEAIRAEQDKKKRNEMKKALPCVVFGGKFSTRTDDGLIAPSGYISLDFDGFDTTETMERRKAELSNDRFIYSVWVSPSGNGLKALVRIPRNSGKFKNYFFSLMEYFGLPEGDMSCQNISRVTYESYDPNIYINKQSAEYVDTIWDIKKYKRLKKLRQSDYVYSKLKEWLNKYDTFREGNRNQYLFKLICAMNRFGIPKSEVYSFVSEFEEPDFDSEEVNTTINNVYDNYSSDFDTVKFNDERSFADGIKESFAERDEKYINPMDLVVNPKIMSRQVHDFYEGKMRKADSTGSVGLDKYFPFKRNEFVFGVGATKVGKSTWMMYIITMAAKFSGWKFIVATTENEAFEIRHTIISFLVGHDCKKYYEGNMDKIKAAEEFFDQHFIIADTTKIRSVEDHLIPIFDMLKSKGVDIQCIIVDPLQAFDSPMRYGRMSEDASHTSLAEDYKRIALSKCSIWVIAHTTATAQRAGMDENKYPVPQHARYGTVYSNACHTPFSLHRNLQASKDTDEYYSTELRIFAQRTKFSKGGDTSTDGGIKFIYRHEPFGFDIEVDGNLEVNPLLPLETYHVASVENTGRIKYEHDKKSVLDNYSTETYNSNAGMPENEDCPF